MSGTFVKQSLAPKLALSCRLVPTLKHARLKMDAMLPSMHGGHKSQAYIAGPGLSQVGSVHAILWARPGSSRQWQLQGV